MLGLLVGHRVEAREIVLVERQPEHAALCRVNAERSVRPVRVVEEDLRTWRDVAPFDLVLANPPFYRPDEGQASRHESVRHATHAHHGDVVAFVSAAAAMLSPTGTLWVVHPADRLSDVFDALNDAELVPTTLALVHARHTGRTYRVWVGAGRTRAPLRTVALSAVTER